MTKLIRPVVNATAGGATSITVNAFNENEALIAPCSGSRHLEHTDPVALAITRAANNNAGTREVALALIGPPRLLPCAAALEGAAVFVGYSAPRRFNHAHCNIGSAASESTNVAITLISDTLAVAVVRHGYDLHPA
jgi:hypothetical protein